MASFSFNLMSIRWLLLLLHAIATDCFASRQLLCYDDESSALLQFKENFSVNACIDPFAHPKTRSWKLEGVNEDCCSWEGIECNEDTGHVIGLDLSSSCLYGSILPWSPTAAFYALFNFKGLILLITTSISPRSHLNPAIFLV